MPPWGGEKTRRRKLKNDHGSAVSRKCPKFRTFLQGDRLSIFTSHRYKVGSEINPALPPPTVKSGYARMLIEL